MNIVPEGNSSSSHFPWLCFLIRQPRLKLVCSAELIPLAVLGEAWSDQKAAASYSPDSGVAPQPLNKKCSHFLISVVLVNSIDLAKPVTSYDDLLSRCLLCEALARVSSSMQIIRTSALVVVPSLIPSYSQQRWACAKAFYQFQDDIITPVSPSQ